MPHRLLAALIAVVLAMGHAAAQTGTEQPAPDAAPTDTAGTAPDADPTDAPTDAPATAPSDAAMAFAGGFSDLHLAGMLQRIGARQPAMIAASQIDAQVLVSVFEAEIAEAVRRHGSAWQRNMALAWTPLLSDEEMLSLATAGAQSPHVEKYLALRPKAGAAMQALSGDLFEAILAEVVGNTLATLAGSGGGQPQEMPAPAE